jgi:hypothetical protein
MEKAVIFCGHLEYFTAIWYILRPCGNVLVIWYISPHFGTYDVSVKIWQHWFWSKVCSLTFAATISALFLA